MGADVTLKDLGIVEDMEKRLGLGLLLRFGGLSLLK